MTLAARHAAGTHAEKSAGQAETLAELPRFARGAPPGRQHGSKQQMTKRTEASASSAEEAALESGDRAGLRSALPYRLERLREAIPNDGAEPSATRQAAGETIVWRPTAGRLGLGTRPVPTVVDTHVGARVRLRRRHLGLSQARLAKALGISFRQLQAHERGLDRIPAGRLRDLGQALGTSLSYFFGDLAAEPGVTSTPPLPDGPKTRALVEAQYALEDPELLRQILELMTPRGSGQ